MNKYEAGYNMLMILSVVDGDFNREEGRVVIDYLKKVHAPFIGTDEENSLLLELSEDALLNHFEEAAYAFYKKHSKKEKLSIFSGAARQFSSNSRKSEQDEFLEVAKRLIISDNKVSPEENTFINQLFKLWGLE